MLVSFAIFNLLITSLCMEADSGAGKGLMKKRLDRLESHLGRLGVALEVVLADEKTENDQKPDNGKAKFIRPFEDDDSFDDFERDMVVVEGPSDEPVVSWSQWSGQIIGGTLSTVLAVGSALNPFQSLTEEEQHNLDVETIVRLICDREKNITHFAQTPEGVKVYRMMKDKPRALNEAQLGMSKTELFRLQIFMAASGQHERESRFVYQ